MVNKDVHYVTLLPCNQFY